MNPATPIVTRAEAKAAGLKRFYTGKPCRDGHVAEQLVGNSQCVVCHTTKQREWARKNREYETARARDWISRNRDRSRAQWHAKKARRLAQMGTVSPGIRNKLRTAQGGKCAACLGDLAVVGEHLDHVMPLHLGGLHDDANLQILCPTCNVRKGIKHPDDFARENGRLL